MKPLSTTRKLRVLPHAPPPCAFPPNPSLLRASPHSSLATVPRFCQIPGAPGCLLRHAAALHPTSTSHLPPIVYAYTRVIRPQLGGKHHPIIRFPKLGLVALGKIAFSEWVGVQPRAPRPLRCVTLFDLQRTALWTPRETVRKDRSPARA